MVDELMDGVSENTEEQNDMAFLRERFLYVLSRLCAEDSHNACSIQMHENTTVTCKVRAFDSDFENVIVENLVTPFPPPIDKAILRTCDIISIHFNCDYTALNK